MAAMHRRLVSVCIAQAVAGGTAAAGAPLDRLRAAIARGDYPNTTSVVVMRDGKVVSEAYFGDGRPALLNDTRSAMKAITALAVGAAIADHAIPSAQALAFPYLADLKPFRNDTPDKEAITLADMMSMSSALDCRRQRRQQSGQRRQDARAAELDTLVGRPADRQRLWARHVRPRSLALLHRQRRPDRPGPPAGDAHPR